MFGGVGDRLSGDGWSVGWLVMVSGWLKGILGGIGVSFLEIERENIIIIYKVVK